MDCRAASQGNSARLPLFLRELRAPFLSASLLPILLGGVLSGGWQQGRSLLLLFMTLLSGGLIHLGSNTLNDYFDFMKGGDSARTQRTPFSGGSGLLVEGLLLPREVLGLSLALIAGAILSGLVVLWLSPGETSMILLLGLTGLFLGWAYTAPPLSLAYRGMGETAVFLAFGPLPVITGAYVMGGELSLASLLASLPPGLMTAAILWINQFPDYETDREAGKRTLLVRMGMPRGRFVYYLLAAAAALTLLAGRGLRLLPAESLWALLFLLPAGAAAVTLHRHYGERERLIPAMGMTIAAQTLLCILMIAALLIGHRAS